MVALRQSVGPGPALFTTIAIESIVGHVAERAEINPLRVGVGHAELPELAAVLGEQLDAVAGVVELVTYEVGPSVGAHTGPGTIGVVYSPHQH